MEDQKNHIVFLCYGAEPVFQECAFALLSLSSHPEWEEIGGFEIWIYTDNPEWFSRFRDCPFPLHFRPIDNATINRWRGAIDFTHRVKIEALIDFTSDHEGNVLYTDTDVVFRDAPLDLFRQIGAGSLFMHVAEGAVDEEQNLILKKLNRYLTDTKSVDNRGKLLYRYCMWNAGVLGFNTSLRNLLPEVLKFTDVHYKSFSKHIVEQFAFSVVFAGHKNIMAAAPFITHYWNLKELRYILNSFFSAYPDAGWKDLQSLSRLIHVDVLMQDKSNFYAHRTIAGKITGKKWLPKIPEWKK